jgi:hypothetical protein
LLVTGAGLCISAGLRVGLCAGLGFGLGSALLGAGLRCGLRLGFYVALPRAAVLGIGLPLRLDALRIRLP